MEHGNPEKSCLEGYGILYELLIFLGMVIYRILYDKSCVMENEVIKFYMSGNPDKSTLHFKDT